jgi:hypothetical protein
MRGSHDFREIVSPVVMLLGWNSTESRIPVKNGDYPNHKWL